MRSVEKMLEISEEESIAWSKAAEKECLFTHSLSISLEAATKLPVSDANGKADPYCRLGLVSRERLCRNEKGRMEELIPKGSVVHTSQVIPVTLEPVWKENFEFKLRGDELLLIEVWDFDEEPERIVSGMRMKGLKAKVKDHLNAGKDDFMGRCVVDFAKLDMNSPCSAWYELTSHSGKTHRGKIHLTLQTKVVLEDSFQQAYREGRQGTELLEKFLLEAGRYCIKNNSASLDGMLPEPFLSASQAIQNLHIMSEFDSSAAKVPFLEKYITKYTYLRDELCMNTLILTSLYEDTTKIVPQKCLDKVSEHFYSIYQHELQLLKRTNDVVGMDHLSTVLNSLKHVFKFLKFTHRLPEELLLNEVLEERILKNIDTWVQLEFEKAQSLYPKRTALEQATVLSEVCCSAAQYLANSFVGYQKPFEKIGVAYFDITYHKIEALLAQKLKDFFKANSMEEHFIMLWKKGETRENEILEKSKGIRTIFRLYQGVRDVVSLSSYAEQSPKNGWCLPQQYSLFIPCIVTWIDITRSVSMVFLERIVKYDSGEAFDKISNINVTSSSVDTSLCFEQCYQFYERLQWPVSGDTFNIVNEHTIVGGDIAVQFAVLMLQRLEKIIKAGIDTKKRFTVEGNACLLLNNVSLAKHYLKDIPSRLKWEILSNSLAPEMFPIEMLQTALVESIENVGKVESQMITIMGNHFEKQFREDYSNFLSQNNGIEFHSAIDPLMLWMINNIQDSCDTLSQEHFIQLLNELWLRVTNTLIEYKENKQRLKGQYKRLHLSLDALYQFFYQNGKGLSEELLHSVDFEILQDYCNLYSLDTKCLIDTYYRELAKANTSNEQKHGCLTFSIYYQTSKGTLNISIIRGENFPRLDNFTGLCNPYITISILPQMNGIKLMRTKSQKKTLSPLFDEDFSFEIPLDTLLENCKVVQLYLWHWDKVLQHPYGGSIYFDLNEVPIISSLFEDTEGKAKPITLNFMFLTNDRILNILGERVGDKQAILFLKHIRGLISAQSNIMATMSSQTSTKSSKFLPFLK